MFLKVSPWKKVMRYGKKGKLSPRFISPYEVIEKVGPVAYCNTPKDTLVVFNMFTVFCRHKLKFS